MENLKQPPPLQFHGELKENWKRFKQKFMLYYKASGYESKKVVTNDQKVALLLHTIGDEGLEVYNTFEKEQGVDETLEWVLEKFESYCTPFQNETMVRHTFFKREKKDNETFDEFVTSLKSLSMDCCFGDLKESLIRDQIVRGIRDAKIAERLLKEQNLDLKKCIQICKSSEMANRQVKQLQDEENTVGAVINTRKAKKNTKGIHQETKSDIQQQSTSKEERTCYRCGYKHGFRCPAYKAQCKFCNGYGHYAKMCRNKKVKMINRNSESESDDDPVLGMIMVGSVTKCLTEALQINNKIIDFKIDTGSDCDVLPLSYVEKLKCKGMIRENLNKLYNYDGSLINCVGTITLKCKLINDKNVTLIFHVVNNKQSCPVLGHSTVLKLGIIERKYLNKIKKEQIDSNYSEMISEYKELFDENRIGALKGVEYSIKLKENSMGRICPPRSIPIALHKPLKKELLKLEKLGVIEKVTEPTEFVSNIVIVKKPSGQIRLCLDPSTLNNCIKREHFKLPTFDEVSAKMTGAKIFSKLDASTAFFHVKLNEDSSRLCTFCTPYGRYCFKRLPYGLSSAPEIFHRQYCQLFESIEGCEVFIDDIVIYAENKKLHDKILRQVLEKAKENGIQLNFSKCQFGVSEITYLGHILSQEGIKPDPKKIESILNLEKPKNVKELQRILGMITYIAKFIPSMSQVCNPLRQLIKKGSEFNWTREHDVAFCELKEILTSEPVLQFYNPDKTCVVSVDASKDALGAVLLQSNLPVAYASKAMTNTQKNYAQIEKELLAIVFGCTRFHQFIYGKTVLVQTDHRPLESIFNKPLCEIPLRLQRMRMQLQKYDLVVKYKPGKELLLADTLSRDVNNMSEENIVIEDLYECQVSMVKTNLSISNYKYNLFKEEVRKDKDLQLLLEYINNGWPNRVDKIPEPLKPYFNFQEQLFVYDNLIFKNSCLVVPKSLRNDMLQRIHYNHLGIEKCKSRARECIYWPKMSKDIEKSVLECSVCERFRKNNSKEPMIIREMPNKPWSVVGSDVFYYNGDPYIIIVDYFSKYFEVIKLSNLSTENTIKIIKTIFCRFGIPDILYTDNGTNYVSYKFKEFAKEWNFVHKTSSPYHHQSNGLAERFVQTVKNIFKKADYEGKDKYLALLEYRNTPISKELNYKCPSELLMGRKIQGLLPTICHNDKENYENCNVQSKLYKNALKQKVYYDQRNTRKLKHLAKYQKVLISDETSKKPLSYAQVLHRNERPNSYTVLTEKGKRLDRNRRDIIESKNTDKFIIKKEVDIDESHTDCNEDNIDKVNDTEITDMTSDSKIDSENTVSNYVTRSGRNVRKPSYLSDYL